MAGSLRTPFVSSEVETQGRCLDFARYERSVWGALLILLFATPAYAGPKPPPGQPPIVKVKPQGVKPYWLQVFDVDAKDVPLKDISIAARYYSWQGQTPPEVMPTVTVDCDVDTSYGGHPCLNRSITVEDKALMWVAVAQLTRRGIAFPSVPAPQADQQKWLPDPLAPGEPALRRVVRFSYRLEPPPERGIDPALGPLVESPNLPEVKGFRGPVDYPSYLARSGEGQTAVVTVECQVQSDLSVICDKGTVTPPENAVWFGNPFRKYPVSWRSAPKLPDGRDARGVRFRKTVRYMWGG